MAALSNVAAFKVGPDFIDPSYHALATGRPGRNLDAFLSGPELIAPLVRHGSAGADIAVIEGVMGLYDGASGRGELASTAHVAKLLQAPVVLVVELRGDGALRRRDRPRLPHVRPRRQRRGRDPQPRRLLLPRRHPARGAAGHPRPRRAAPQPEPRSARAPPRARPRRRAPAPRARRDRAPRRGDQGVLRPRGDRRAREDRARPPRRGVGTRGRAGPRAGGDRPRPRVLLPLRGEPRAAPGRGRRAGRVRPAHRRGAARGGRADPRRRLPGDLRRRTGRERRPQARHRRLRRPDPRRVRWPAVPGRDA